MLARSAMKNEKTSAKRRIAMIASARILFRMRRRRDGNAAGTIAALSSCDRLPNPKCGKRNEETVMIIIWIMSESPENGLSEGITVGVGEEASILFLHYAWMRSGLNQ